MTLGTDREGVEILDADECDHLLRHGRVGRIAFLVDGEVGVYPVAYTIDGHSPAFRTGRGEKLEAALLDRVVAFEIDDWDADRRTGWSVIVRGTAQVVTDAESIARLEESGLEPWAPGTRDRWVRILAQEITGRRIR